MKLWRISAPDSIPWFKNLAVRLDVILERQLALGGQANALDLDEDGQHKLLGACADMIREQLKVEIPPALVKSTAGQACVILGIKEEYIYRDWQSAIGDLMIKPVQGSLRRFDLIGYGEFESRYRVSKATPDGERIWFERLESLFHELDMSKKGDYDARRAQMSNLLSASELFEAAIEKKLESFALSVPTQAAEAASATTVA